MNNQKIHVGHLCHTRWKITFSLFFFLLLTHAAATASTNYYHKHGVSFNYPTKYTLSEVKKKRSYTVKLKDGHDAIDIRIMEDTLVGGFDNTVIKILTKNYKDAGHGLSNVSKETKLIPLHVKGNIDPVNVEAVKFYQLVEIREGALRIKMKQTIFFFSYADQGYTITYNRVKGKYSDLVTVLSTFSFDEKEVMEPTDNEGVY